MNNLTVNELTGEHLNIICSHVINGGSVIELSEMWGIPFDKLWLWMQEDKARAQLYDKAVHAQNEWAIVNILRELKRLAFSDHRDMYDENKRLKHPTQWSKEVGAVVQSYKVTEYFEGSGKDKEQMGWTTEVKMYDKQKAIELYGKYLKLFGERIADSGLTLEDLVEASNDMRSKSRLPGVFN